MAVAGLRRADGTAPGGRPDDSVAHRIRSRKSMTATAGPHAWSRGRPDRPGTRPPGEGFRRPLSPTCGMRGRTSRSRRSCAHASGMGANLGLLATLLQGQGPREDYVSRVLSEAPEAERGGYLYSNAGYVGRGRDAWRRRAGASWEDLGGAGGLSTRLACRAQGSAPPAGGPAHGPSRGADRGGGGGGGGLRPVPPGGRVAEQISLRWVPPGRGGICRAATCCATCACISCGRRDYLSADSWERLHRAEGPGDYAMGWIRSGRRTAPLGVEHPVVRGRCASTRPRGRGRLRRGQRGASGPCPGPPVEAAAEAALADAASGLRAGSIDPFAPRQQSRTRHDGRRPRAPLIASGRTLKNSAS